MKSRLILEAITERMGGLEQIKKSLEALDVDTSNLKSLPEIAEFAHEAQKQPQQSCLRDWANLFSLNLKEALYEKR